MALRKNPGNPLKTCPVLVDEEEVAALVFLRSQQIIFSAATLKRMRLTAGILFLPRGGWLSFGSIMG
jgi:hypothetical protein